MDSSYSDYINALAGNAASTAGTSGISNTLNTTGAASSDDDLMKACKQFESYFVEQLFKEMEKTVPTDESETSGSNSQLMDYYKDNLIQQYATESTEQKSLGIAQMLYDQMKRNYGITDTSSQTEGTTASAADDTAGNVQ